MTLISKTATQTTAKTPSVVVRSALATALCLIGTFIVGALVGDLLFNGLSGHWQERTRVALAAVPALFSVVAGGALWGRASARISRVGDAKRMTWAGALGFGPTVIVVALGLTVMLTSNLAASLAAGAVVGWLLIRRQHA
jgi:hypothetical protein